MENLSRPHPDNVMSYEEAVAKLPNYQPWVNNIYVDKRTGEKCIVVEVIAAPAIDPGYFQFMSTGRNPKMFGDIPYQIIVLKEKEKNHFVNPHIHLIDFETHFLSIS